MRFIAAALLTVVFALPVLAVEPPVDNDEAVLCVYTAADTGDAETFMDGVVAGEVYRLYFVLWHAEMRSHALGAFEFSWGIEPANVAPTVLDMQWGVQFGTCYNFGDYQNMLVGYTMFEPHTPDRPFVLFSVDIVFDETPSNAALYLAPSEPASIAGEMAYCGYVLPDELWTMVPNNPAQSMSDPVFLFNSPVAVESHSLSSVKALFN